MTTGDAGEAYQCAAERCTCTRTPSRIGRAPRPAPSRRPARHPHALPRDPTRALRGASWTPAPNCCSRWPSTPVNLVPVPRTGTSTEDMIETSGSRNTRKPPPRERRGHLLETPSTRHDFRRLRLPRYRSTLTTTTATRERPAHLPGTRFSGSGSSLSRSARSSASSCTPRRPPSGSPRWRPSSAAAASELSSGSGNARPSSPQARTASTPEMRTTCTTSSSPSVVGPPATPWTSHDLLTAVPATSSKGSNDLAQHR